MAPPQSDRQWGSSGGGYESRTRTFFRSLSAPTMRPSANSSRPRRQSQSSDLSLLGLLRLHWPDWALCVSLLLLKVVLLVAPTFISYVDKDHLVWLRYPIRKNTVPGWALQIIQTVIPGVAVLIFFALQRNKRDMHHGLLGLFTAVVFTNVIVSALKSSVGRPRPDFAARCFPDGKEDFSQTGEVLCTGARALVEQGHESFPSGHAAYSAVGLGYLALYLAGKLKLFDEEGHVSKSILVLFPMLLAILVGVSRVDDNKHHWQDVLVGLGIGFSLAWWSYHHYYPPLRATKCDVPRDFQNEFDALPTISEEEEHVSLRA
ncbi:lipid phosphate phosphatase [Klebsormidium nitens]|uniref:Lipid phosphate phosphatase n=1 Tax=Klebsormidium nitens TaxID=105231 RepID=A0A1Y1INX9_KLENI|nr:lipid phosphate phosphatase [Klebsormidium nitens]|eukprot:GAQ90486.1 lipid phosphate phosphatase [Klebsormidium nitens]